MRVRAGQRYIYYPNMMDRYRPCTSLAAGTIVTVVNLPGCPKANTMGHCHIEFGGVFAGLVSTNSLYPMKDEEKILRRILQDQEKSIVKGENR